MAETSGRDSGRDEPARRLDAGVTRQPRGELSSGSARPPAVSRIRVRAGTPGAPVRRPWVGQRFVRGLLLAVPLGIGLWVLIAWAVSQLF